MAREKFSVPPLILREFAVLPWFEKVSDINAAATLRKAGNQPEITKVSKLSVAVQEKILQNALDQLLSVSGNDPTERVIECKDHSKRIPKITIFERESPETPVLSIGMQKIKNGEPASVSFNKRPDGTYRPIFPLQGEVALAELPELQRAGLVLAIRALSSMVDPDSFEDFEIH